MARDDSDSIWLYNPSFALAILGTVLYALPTAVQVFQTVSYRTWYFIPVAIGGVLELVGYIFRVYAVRNQTLIVCFPLLTLGLDISDTEDRCTQRIEQSLTIYTEK